ncbi:equilibrative nucleoside transporter 1 isoform X2 [Protopterus annectens]|uniref:equilibrative nucleoside transporter 1 isoform X2 n=1 Tax=Protopterus annectens TaxID=7888 RepID=UPI001CFB1698|nr:equilibrative nucleoside transporter 1 isoform X2 [Protopterus annectens]
MLLGRKLCLLSERPLDFGRTKLLVLKQLSTVKSSNSQPKMNVREGPKDKYKGVWLIFFMLGLGTLLPWNFFMTATMYFTERLGQEGPRFNTTANYTLPPPRTALQLKFNNVMTLCAMLPLLIFTCLNSFIHQRIPQKVRIVGSLIAIFIVFMLTAMFVKIAMDPILFFTLTMVKIVFINSFGAIFQGSLFGLAGLLPAAYTTPVMSGQGLAGTFAAFSMICALASGSDLEDSAFGYFITACVVILLAIMSYFALPKLEFFNFYANKQSNSYEINKTSTEQETMIDRKKDEEANGKQATLILVEQEMPSSVPAIFKQIWVMALSVCCVFAVTIGVFPAVTVDVKSIAVTDSSWGKYFIPVSCFLLFNLMDWAGRSLTAIRMWPGKDSKLLPIFVIARIIFIPFFIFCNVQPRNIFPVFFHHDAWYITFMIFFAFSNGYLASLCMCYGPQKVQKKDAETAGAIMAFFLSLGLALGASLSFLFRGII